MSGEASSSPLLISIRQKIQSSEVNLRLLNNLKLTIVAAMAVSIVAGCGFRLQGNYQIPIALKTLNIQSSDKYSEITRLVTTQLQQQDVSFSDKATTPIVRLGKEKFERGTLSLFSSGQVAEYELIYTLDYQVIKTNEAPQAFNVSIRRDYLDDPQSAQAKSREREQLLREIRQQAARQIVQQLSRL